MLIPCGIVGPADARQQALGQLFLSTYTEDPVWRGAQLIAGTVKDYLDPAIHGYVVFPRGVRDASRE